MKKQTPSWSIRGRIAIEKKDYNPGPGTYSPAKHYKCPNYSLGRSERPSIAGDGSSMPGPGAYSIASTLTRGSVFGTGIRTNKTKSESPGPGTYLVSPRSNGPVFTLKPRLSNLKSAEVPGPGTYFPKNLHKWSASPRWAIGREERKYVRDNGMPGPGTYYNGFSANGPRWRFSNSARSTFKSDQSPGPAAYTIS